MKLLRRLWQWFIEPPAWHNEICPCCKKPHNQCPDWWRP